jgi:hypothetical protein
MLVDYFAAWNETDAGERRRLLEQSLSDDAELVDPLGPRWSAIRSAAQARRPGPASYVLFTGL